VEAAQDAFIQGMRVSSAIATIVAVAVAVLAVSMLRHVRSGADRPTDEARAGIASGVVVAGRQPVLS
jgi:hypothetical protein